MTTWDWPTDFDNRLAASSEVRALLDFAGAIVERGAIARAPVSDPAESPADPPGRLKASIHREHGADALGGYVDVGSDLDYALPVELGRKAYVQVLPNGKKIRHSRVPPQPFLRPALDDLRNAL